MTPQSPAVAEATRQLRQALEDIAGALTSANLDALLDAEGALELALLRLSTLPSTLPPSDRDAVRREVQAARQMLQRCRRLGASLMDVVRLSLDAQGRGQGYGRHTDAVPAQLVSTRG